LIDSGSFDTVDVMRRTHERFSGDEPPSFVRLASHPLRWHLLRELVQSDRAVRELTRLLDEPQSLVSYHLRLLRDGGLVTSRRSSADGRDSYYAIDLNACRDGLQSAGGALHPSLNLTPMPTAVERAASSRRCRRVLFLCTGNSARSQIAEALLKRMSGGATDAVSAGSHPKQLHPNAIRALRKRGIDISQNRTKHLDEFRSERFDAVITLCDRVREVCPTFPSRPELIHWSVPDPGLEGSSNRATYPAFERTVAELETRIRFRLPLLEHTATQRRTTNDNR
jgi:ArsR family transcriptional regulator, arsenate/arsenite/antimonite-responsive transcriptional repressor / arsenate reductase (thioredoxin)